MASSLTTATIVLPLHLLSIPEVTKHIEEVKQGNCATVDTDDVVQSDKHCSMKNTIISETSYLVRFIYFQTS